MAYAWYEMLHVASITPRALHSLVLCSDGLLDTCLNNWTRLGFLTYKAENAETLSFNIHLDISLGLQSGLRRHCLQ